MSTGMVIDVTRPESGRRPARVISARTDLRTRYRRLAALVMQTGTWLSSDEAALLSPEAWEAQFRDHQARMEELRHLGNQLRPVSLRPRHEPLMGDALVDEVAELFAA